MEREFQKIVPLFVATLAWVGSLGLAQFGPELIWGDDPVVSWIVIAVNVVLGVAWIVVHARYLRGVDDLQRKIFMDAIAVALGAGLVIGFAYAAANAAGLVAVESEIAFLSVLMAVTYIAAILTGTVRYR